MFKSYHVHSHSKNHRNKPTGYYHIQKEPTGLIDYEVVIVCSKEQPTFDEIINCLRKCIFNYEYIGCYSFIYWEYYREFYHWIKKSFEDKNTSNIKIITKFYKKALTKWLEFIEYSDDTLYPQNQYLRMMGKEINNHLSYHN